ncbi:MAG: PQQ-dependent sugar dehydrogenase [Devosia sp.]
MPNYLLTGLAPALFLLAVPVLAADTPPGKDQAIGQQFRISADALPAPGATPSEAAPPTTVPRGAHVPVAPEGFKVSLFVDGLQNPRRLLVRDDGNVFFSQQELGRILKLHDVDANGSADQGGLVMEGALNPFGIATIPAGEFKGDLMLADQDAVYRLPLATRGYNFFQVTPDGAFGEPKGHITRSLAIDPASGDLYVGVGSMNNLSDSEPPMKAAILKFSPDGKTQSIFAIGMRNVTGMAFQPGTNALYAVTMERDGMGDELVPDYFTRVESGDNFGWPYQYIGGNAQPEYQDKGLKLVGAKVPDVLFEAHSAPLDLAFIPDSWPAAYRGDAIVALHGSWNAGTPRGYKLVRVHFKDGKPDGSYENFLTGFWVSGTSPAEVWGRPAALAFDKDGSLLVADDLGNTIWHVTPPKS